MNITHVGLGGGVGMIIAALAAGLPRVKSSVIWFGPGETSSPTAASATWAGSFNVVGLLRSVVTLWRMLRRQAPDVVIAHGLIPAIFTPWLAKLAGTKRVIVVEHGPQPTYTFAKSLLLRLAYPWVDWTVSVSRESQTWLRKNFSFIPAVKNSVIENGIDFDRFKDIPPRVERRPFVVSMIARLDEPQKDLLTPIAAMARLKQRNVDVHLRFVGSGNAVAKMLTMIRAEHLEQSVTIEPFRPDVEKVLSESNIALLSTHWEGLPLGVIEAMAAGRPVIASNVIGIRSIIVDGVNGWTYPENDAPALAKVIQQAHEHPSLQPLGEAAKELVKQRFSRDRMVSEYAQLVAQVVGQS